MLTLTLDEDNFSLINKFVYLIAHFHDIKLVLFLPLLLYHKPKKLHFIYIPPPVLFATTNNFTDLCQRDCCLFSGSRA